MNAAERDVFAGAERALSNAHARAMQRAQKSQGAERVMHERNAYAWALCFMDIRKLRDDPDFLASLEPEPDPDPPAPAGAVSLAEVA